MVEAGAGPVQELELAAGAAAVLASGRFFWTNCFINICQVFAVRIIWMILTGQDGWRTLKRILDTQIATLEPYIESMPSTFTYAIIMTAELWAKRNLAFQHMGDEENNTIFHTNFFIFTATSSVLVSNFGVVKFFKNGPTRFLSSDGPLSGFGSSKAVLTFLAVLFTNMAKGGFLVEIVLNQTMERWFLSLLSSGPENIP